MAIRINLTFSLLNAQAMVWEPLVFTEFDPCLHFSLEGKGQERAALSPSDCQRQHQLQAFGAEISRIHSGMFLQENLGNSDFSVLAFLVGIGLEELFPSSLSLLPQASFFFSNIIQ